MSLGRYDPNAAKLRYIPPEQYERNLANIAQAKATLEAFEKMNDEGRRRHEQLQKEELELEKRVQEGLLASQRLQQLRDQRTSIDQQTNSDNRDGYANSARIEEVNTNKPIESQSLPRDQGSSSGRQPYAPSSNNLYLPVQQETVGEHGGYHRPQKHAQYPATSNIQNVPSMSQTNYGPSQRTSYSNSGGYVARVVPPEPQYQKVTHQTYVYQPLDQPRWTSYSYPTQTQTNQYGSASLVEGQSVQFKPIQTQANLTRSNQASHSGQPVSKTPNIQYHPQQSNPANHPNAVTSQNTSSSLAGALGTIETTKTFAPSTNPTLAPDPPITSQQETPLPSKISYNIPTHPTRQDILDFKAVLVRWKLGARPGSLFPSQITYQRISIGCVKQGDGSVFLVMPTPTGIPIYTPLDSFIEHLLKNCVESSSANNQTPVAISSTQSALPQGGLIPNTTTSAQITSLPPTQSQLKKNPAASHSAPLPSSSLSGSLLNQSHTQPQLKQNPVASHPAPLPPSSLSGSLLNQSNITGISQNISLPTVSTVPDPPAPTQAISALPATRQNHQNAPVRTPLDANLRHLAHDILYNLGKRRRANGDFGDQLAKRHASQPLEQNTAATATPIRTSIITVPSKTSLAPPPTNLPVGNAVETPKPSSIPVNHFPPQKATSEAAPKEVSQTVSTLPPELATPGHISDAKSARPARTVNSQTIDSTPELSTVADTSLEPTNVPSTTPVSVKPSLPSISISPDNSLVPQIATIDPIGNPAQGNDTSSVSMELASGVIDLTTPDPSPPRSVEPDEQITSPSREPAKPREPLFLPSSPSSPRESFPAFPQSSPDAPSTRSKGEAPQTSDSEAVEIRYRKKENLAYVLLPPPPEYLVRYREQQAQKGTSTYSRTVPNPSSSLRGHYREESQSASVGGGAEISHLFESQRNSPLDEEEREAIKLSTSRIQKLSCRWDGCDRQLNSVDSLLLHLGLHIPERGPSTKFMCRWTQCGQSGINFKDGHVARHALLSLKCAYLNCDDTFRFGSQLLKHFKIKHKNGTLKPSAIPSPPAALPSLVNIPPVVPSYLIATNPVRHKVLTNEKHQVLGKWVATNIIYSDHDAPPKKRPKKAARSTNPNAMNAEDANNVYEFLKIKTTRPSTYSSHAFEMALEDLDSTEISRMFASGLTLWGSGDEETNGNSGAGSPATDESPLSTPQQPVRSDIKEEEDGEGLVSYGGVESRHASSDVEDAAVESMLTGMALT